MDIVKNAEPQFAPIARQMTRLEIIKARITTWWIINIIRKFPRLVWYGDDVDITLTFTDLRLSPESHGVTMPDGSVSWDIRYEGDMETLWKAEDALMQIGLSFDKGTGCTGRDWEFDYSLRGPVKIAFRKKHKGDRKAEEPRPPLRLIHNATIAGKE